LEADQIGSDGYTSLSADGHAVQSQVDSLLLQGQHATLKYAIVDEHGIFETSVGDGGAAVDEGAIGVTDLNISGDLTTPSGEGAIADLEILQLKEFSLPSRDALSHFGDGFDRVIIDTGLFLDRPASAGQNSNQDQYEQQTSAHGLSFGSPTLPPDLDGVNYSHTLSAEQIELLIRATVTIAYWVDGYLALTLLAMSPAEGGTTITLDTDPDGY
jgi:hypothetical protein